VPVWVYTGFLFKGSCSKTEVFEQLYYSHANFKVGALYMKDLKKLFGIISIIAIIACAIAACGAPFLHEPVGPNPTPTTPTITVTGIAITTPPAKTQYNLGEELNTTGMVVTATYSDGSTGAVTGYDTSGYTKTVLGNQTVTVTYNGKTASFTVNVVDPNRQTVATPAASIAAGTYSAAQSVTLSCATENAAIYYTTNGNNPTETSARYSGAINISATTTLKAIAVKDGMNNSSVLTAVYTIQTGATVATPTANPAAGAVQKGAEVTLATSTEGAEIWYTTNGNAPAKNGAGSTKYTAKIAINAATTIKAIAVKDGWSDSGILTAAYTIQAGGVAPGGTYVITGSGTSFTATNGGATIGSGAIQDVINAIRTHAAGTNLTIQFGNGTTTLDTGTETVAFDNSGGTWGAVTLTGKITASVSSSSTGTIYIDNSVSVTSTADIANSAAGIAICSRSTGTLTISGGTVSVTSGTAVFNMSTGAIKITDGTVSGTNYAVYNLSAGAVTISSGTVSATSGTAVFNYSTGTVDVTGGTVLTTTGIAMSNASAGTVSITGGTVSATTGYAVLNFSNGKITVSGTAKVTSANTTNNGTIQLTGYNNTATTTQLEITGGIVENTSTTTGIAVCNFSTGAVSITGGTVSKAGDGNYAVYNGGEGKVTIGPGAKIIGNNYGF
jgi:hypothetical protein